MGLSHIFFPYLIVAGLGFVAGYVLLKYKNDYSVGYFLCTFVSALFGELALYLFWPNFQIDWAYFVISPFVCAVALWVGWSARRK